MIKDTPPAACAVTFMAENTSTITFSGAYQAVGASVEAYEQHAISTGRSYTLCEGQQAIQPIDHIPVNKKLMYDVDGLRSDSGIIVKTLHEIGVFSCADVIVAGSDYIKEAKVDTLRIGAKRMAQLANAVLHATGLKIPEGRAESLDYLNLYTDIREASPIVMRTVNSYADFQFTEQVRDIRLGDIAALDPWSAQRITNSPKGIQLLLHSAQTAAKTIQQFDRAHRLRRREIAIAGIQEVTC